MREDIGNGNFVEVVTIEGTVATTGTVSLSGGVTIDANEAAPGGASFLAPAQVSTVANVTTQLVAANAARTLLMVSSLSTNTANITLTVSGGAITDGYILEPGDAIEIPCAAAIFYRTATASQVLSMFEVRV